MTLRGKILAFSLTIGTIGFLLAGLTAGAIYLISQDRERSDLVRLIDQSVRDTEALATEILLDGGTRPFLQWKSLSADLASQIQGLSALPGVSAGVVIELLSRLEAMDRAFARIATLGTVGDPLTRSILAAQIRTNKGALISRITDVENRIHSDQDRTFRIVIWANAIVLGILMLLGIGHQFVLRGFANRALGEVVGAIRQIEGGQLSEPIASTRSDEIGWILVALETMRARLNQRVLAEDSARQKAEELSQAKTQFVASVSHELRTPLMGLLGMMDLALRREDSESIRRDLKTAQTAGNHLLDLVNQILDFSKIEAGKMEIAEEPFSPDTLIETARSVFAVQASEKGIQLDLMTPETSSTPLLGDPQRLSQVLFNLVGNAVKFTDVGAVTLTYRLEPLAEDRCRLRVDVVDTGPGIPVEKQSTIFEEFAQVGERGVSGKVGTGLGLTISSRLMALMNGEIGILPDTKKGSHFYFAVDLDLAPEQMEVLPEHAQVPAEPVRTCRVLVTEDVDVNRTIVAEYLMADGHSVAEAANGVECLEQLSAGTFDIVLMDVNMPVMDGLEATKAIRASSEPWNNIPIIGLTANAFEEQVAEYIAAGMTHCVSKPVVPSELRSALAKAIDPLQAEQMPSRSIDTATDIRLDDVPLVDTDKLVELRNLIGPEKLSELIERSRSILAKEIDQVGNTAEHGRSLETALHKIKGTAANITYLRLSAMAAREPTLLADNGSRKQLTSDLHALAQQSETRAVELLHELGSSAS